MAAVGFGAFVAATYANQAYVKEGEAWTRDETVQNRPTEKVEPTGEEACSRKQRHRRFKR